MTAFRTAVESGGGGASWSPHGAELRRRRSARNERQAREREEIQRKKDDEERMQRTLQELEQQRQVRTYLTTDRSNSIKGRIVLLNIPTTGVPIFAHPRLCPLASYLGDAADCATTPPGE